MRKPVDRARRHGVMIVDKTAVPITTLDASDREKIMCAAGPILVGRDGGPAGPLTGERFWAFGCAKYEATLAMVEQEMQRELDRLTKENADLRQTNRSLEALVDRGGTS